MAWAAVGFGVAAGSLHDVNADALVVVSIATVVFPAAAVAAALAVRHGWWRLSGALLIVSAATPTTFAWALNIPALVVGVVLLVGPVLYEVLAP